MKPASFSLLNSLKGKVALVLDWILRFFVDLNPVYMRLNAGTFLKPSVRDKVLVFVSYNSEDHVQGTKSIFFDYFISSGWTVLWVENGDSQINVFNNHHFHFMKRNNKGRDLGAYRDLADYLSNYSGVLLFLNSSIYWEMSDVDHIIRDCEELVDKGADVVGITDSYQTGVRHLQSYFFFFSAGSIERGAHRKAFSHVKNWRFKRAIVRYGEIPILNKLQESGFNISVIQPYESLKKQFVADNEVKNIYSVNDYKQITKRLKVGTPLNPTQHFAPILWMNLKVLKASFVDSNPANLETRLPNK
jgi:hypothetical protein